MNPQQERENCKDPALMKTAACLPRFAEFDKKTDQLTVMTYNVENLFDTEHDEGKDDFSYLPKDYPGKKEACKRITVPHWRKQCFEADWTNKRYQLKLEQIRRVLSYTGTLPDIMAFNEIENEAVLASIADRLLIDVTTLITDSPDKRGIDVGLIYNPKKLIFESQKEHILEDEYFEKKPTRNILEANFVFKEQKLTVLVNHWPSQGNPAKARIAAAKKVQEIVLQKYKEGRAVVILGDFNTVDSDAPHPFKNVLYETKVEGKSIIFDSFKVKQNQREMTYQAKKKLPKGTNFYPRNMTWSFLDRIFVTSNLVAQTGLVLDKLSHKVHAPSFIRRDFVYNEGFHAGTIIGGIPFRSNHKADTSDKAGYSDHFPVSIVLKYLK